VGTVTTGDPGTQAQVVNSGTNQAAVFDFTIPRGDTGESQPVSLFSTYSTPPQGGSSGSALLFDQNGVNYGSDITHTAGSGTVTIQTPGVYSVAFHGVLAPTVDSKFPVSINLNLQQDGATVPGASLLHTFNSSSETVNQALSVPITVSQAPSNLQMVGEGGNFLYSATAMTVTRLGDIPTS
jgi:hypothetical protein